MWLCTCSCFAYVYTIQCQAFLFYKKVCMSCGRQVVIRATPLTFQWTLLLEYWLLFLHGQECTVYRGNSIMCTVVYMYIALHVCMHAYYFTCYNFIILVLYVARSSPTRVCVVFYVVCRRVIQPAQSAPLTGVCCVLCVVCRRMIELHVASMKLSAN